MILPLTVVPANFRDDGDEGRKNSLQPQIWVLHPRAWQSQKKLARRGGERLIPSGPSVKVMVPSTPEVPFRTQTALAGICRGENQVVAGAGQWTHRYPP